MDYESALIASATKRLGGSLAQGETVHFVIPAFTYATFGQMIVHVFRYRGRSGRLFVVTDRRVMVCNGRRIEREFPRTAQIGPLGPKGRTDLAGAPLYVSDKFASLVDDADADA